MYICSRVPNPWQMTAILGEYGVSKIDLGIRISGYKELTAGLSEYGVCHLDSVRTYLRKIINCSCLWECSSKTDDLVNNT